MEAFGCLQIRNSCTRSVHIAVYSSRSHVEYIGEIVGLRVADKREVEYQSGRRIQYKSACYFFRIDQEHIIDATLKGGIARFVNHSWVAVDIISANSRTTTSLFSEYMTSIGCRLAAHPHTLGKLASATAGGKVFYWTRT